MDHEDIANMVAALRIGDFEGFRKLTFPHDGEDIGAALAASHGTALDLFQLLLDWPLDRQHLALHALVPAIGQLPAFTVKDGCALLAFAGRLDAALRTSCSPPLQDQFAKNPGLGTCLGEQFFVDHAGSSEAMDVWAPALMTAEPEGAVTFVVERAGQSETHLRLALHLLCSLPIDHPGTREILGREDTSLLPTVLESIPNKGRLAWFALSKLAMYVPAATEELLAALNVGVLDATSAVAHCMYRQDGVLFGAAEAPLGSVVHALIASGLNSPEVRPVVDIAMSALVRRPLTKGHVEAELLRLVNVDVDVAKLFENTFHLLESDGAATRIFTSWLLTESAVFSCWRSVIAACEQKRHKPALDAEQLRAAAPERRAKLMLRLLASYQDADVLCEYVDCIARMEFLEREGEALIGRMLHEVFLEYPAELEDFLKRRVAEKSARIPVLKLYRGFLKSALRWRGILERLPERGELRLPLEERLLARGARRRFFQAVTRGAGESSLLLQTITRVNMAQGLRCATYGENGPGPISKLGSFSQRLSLPTSELADPMRGVISRLQLRTLAK